MYFFKILEGIFPKEELKTKPKPKQSELEFFF
jgi:hypothetical protein